MATATYEEADDRGTTPTRRGAGSRERTTSRTAGTALSTAAIFDMIERLGVVDMVIDRIRGRLEEIDIDELLDEAGTYLKRNPEVLVVSLGAITIAAGALVYLNKRNEGGARSQARRTSTQAGGSKKRTPGSSR